MKIFVWDKSITEQHEDALTVAVAETEDRARALVKAEMSDDYSRAFDKPPDRIFDTNFESVWYLSAKTGWLSWEETK